MRLWVLAYVGLYNARAQPTTIRKWTLTIIPHCGEKRVLSQDLSLRDDYWNGLLPEGRPAKTGFFVPGLLYRNVWHEGWLGFQCSIDDLEAERYIATATDSRGAEF